MGKIQPLNEQFSEDDDGISELTNEMKPSFAVSFKFCLIATTSTLVALSVIILTGIWLASITSTSVEMSTKIRENEFYKIKQFCKHLIDNVYLSSNTATSQLFVNFNSSNFDQKASSMYRMYVSEIKSGNKDTCVCLFIADSYETLVGMYVFGGRLNQFTAIKDVHLKMWNCEDENKKDYCTMKTTPDVITPPFDNHRPVKACNDSPDGAFFLPSFVDVSYDDVFLTFVKCFTYDSYHKASDNNLKFQWLFAYQLSSASLTDFLISSTEGEGIISLVMEIDTGYILATNKPNETLSSLDSQGNVQRKGLLDPKNPDILEVSSFIYNEFDGDIKSKLSCGGSLYLSTTTRYVSIYRMCLGIDWLLVYSVPVWNYSGSLIIAVVCASLGGVFIMVSSALLGVLLSVKIVSPFKNLIKLFDSVSHMELDSLEVKQSSFQEVQQLQYHFLSMVRQIKLYRSFLPSHLLAQLDNSSSSSEDAEVNGDQNQGKPSESKLQQDDLKSHKSLSNSTTNGFSSSHHSGRSMFKSKGHTNRFDLYLENKSSTAVALYINGLSYCFTQQSKSEKEILQALKEIFEITNSISNQFNSQRGNLENDTIILSFNTSSNVKHHEIKAVEAAYLMKKKIEKLTEKWNQSFDHQFFAEHLDFKIAVCHDNTYCGNVGTNDCKNFTSISGLKSHLKNLFERSRFMNVKIILSDAIFKKALSKFEMRCIGKVEWSSGNSEFSLFPSDDTQNMQFIHVYELGEPSEVKMDEWLYELEQKEKIGRWKLYTLAYEHFEKEKYQDAKQMWTDFLAKYPEDVPTQQFIRECESKI